MSVFASWAALLGLLALHVQGFDETSLLQVHKKVDKVAPRASQLEESSTEDEQLETTGKSFTEENDYSKPAKKFYPGMAPWGGAVPLPWGGAPLPPVLGQSMTQVQMGGGPAVGSRAIPWGGAVPVSWSTNWGTKPAPPYPYATMIKDPDVLDKLGLTHTGYPVGMNKRVFKRGVKDWMRDWLVERPRDQQLMVGSYDKQVLKNWQDLPKRLAKIKAGTAGTAHHLLQVDAKVDGKPQQTMDAAATSAEMQQIIADAKSAKGTAGTNSVKEASPPELQAIPLHDPVGTADASSEVRDAPEGSDKDDLEAVASEETETNVDAVAQLNKALNTQALSRSQVIAQNKAQIAKNKQKMKTIRMAQKMNSKNLKDVEEAERDKFEQMKGQKEQAALDAELRRAAVQTGEQSNADKERLAVAEQLKVKEAKKEEKKQREHWLLKRGAFAVAQREEARNDAAAKNDEETKNLTPVFSMAPYDIFTEVGMKSCMGSACTCAWSNDEKKTLGLGLNACKSQCMSNNDCKVVYCEDSVGDFARCDCHEYKSCSATRTPSFPGIHFIKELDMPEPASDQPPTAQLDQQSVEELSSGSTASRSTAAADPAAPAAPAPEEAHHGPMPTFTVDANGAYHVVEPAGGDAAAAAAPAGAAMPGSKMPRFNVDPKTGAYSVIDDGPAADAGSSLWQEVHAAKVEKPDLRLMYPEGGRTASLDELISGAGDKVSGEDLKQQKADKDMWDKASMAAMDQGDGSNAQAIYDQMQMDEKFRREQTSTPHYTIESEAEATRQRGVLGGGAPGGPAELAAQAGAAGAPTSPEDIKAALADAFKDINFGKEGLGL